MNDNADQSFASNRHKWKIVAGAGVVGLIEAATHELLLNEIAKDPGLLIAVVGSAAMFLIAAVYLLRADKIRRKRQAGHRIGLVSRLLFGAGLGSAMIWLFGLLIVGFPLAIWLGMLLG